MDPEVASIVKAIALAENGGHIPLDKPVAGQSGEVPSIFQFLPSTWKQYAKETLGDENIPLNNETEAAVVYKKVEKWVKAGYTPKQIASMWNAGEAKPDAWDRNRVWDFQGQKIKGWSAVNKHGVKFDTPGYADKVEKYYHQSKKELGINKPSIAPPSTLPQLATSQSTMPVTQKYAPPVQPLPQIKPLI